MGRDISLMPAIVRIDDLGLGEVWNKRPKIARWFELIRAHPAFKPTYYFRLAVDGPFPHLQKKAG